MPATVAGTSERMSARSRFLPLLEPLPVPRRLMSQKTPEARKPCGAVMEPGICFINFEIARGSDQSCRFRKATHDVHALDGLAAGAFDDVVHGAHDDEAARADIKPPGDFNNVGADDMLGI